MHSVSIKIYFNPRVSFLADLMNIIKIMKMNKINIMKIMRNTFGLKMDRITINKNNFRFISSGSFNKLYLIKPIA